MINFNNLRCYMMVMTVMLRLRTLDTKETTDLHSLKDTFSLRSDSKLCEGNVLT